MDSKSRGVARLRLAHLIESDGPGGAERVVVQLASALQASGAHNVVFLPADGEGWLGRELNGSGVTIEYVRIERPISPRAASALRASLLRHQIAVAHSHEFSMAVYGAWASWRAGIPHVITMHGARYYAERLRRRLALRAAIALSGQTVAVSDRLAGEIGRDLGVRRSRILTIPNGVKPNGVKPNDVKDVKNVPTDRVTLRDELGLGPRDRLLVAVGNLYPVKGHQYLVDALALLADSHPTLHVAISGRGQLEGPLASRARDYGLDGRVHLLGLRADIPAILAAADIFVLPSLSEGLPLALLEAMFAARPIVASDVGEVRVALADGQAGVLVPPGDAAALAAALDRLLRAPKEARELGDRAASRARKEYDLSRMVERYVGIYESVLARQTGARTRLPTEMHTGFLGRIG